jgi:prepilin-type N-terminal cleavage/methylation domain-containing protein
MTKRNQAGFTLMEILVATTIFAGTLTLMLVLFNYTLRINRRVESLRQVSQATRNFAEFLAREIRNGNVDYTGTIDAARCGTQYSLQNNQSLGLVNQLGDRECFFLEVDPTDSSKANLKVTKKTVTGTVVTEQVNPPNISIDPASFRIHVRPTTNPATSSGGVYPGVQPFVTLVMNIRVKLGAADPIMDIPYQTTVSTDIYDIPHR